MGGTLVGHVSDGGYVQLIPATYWYAAFSMEDGTVMRFPLACWALTDEGDVVGLLPDADGSLDNAATSDNFAGYDFEPQRTP